jgi:NifU-like protein involved in Fe-S cluster formation
MPDADFIGRGSLNGRAPYTEIYLKVANQTVLRASFTTFGCGASIACASVATELLTGRSLVDCLAISEAEISDALDGLPSDKQFCAGIVAVAVRDAVAQAMHVHG